MGYAGVVFPLRFMVPLPMTDLRHAIDAVLHPHEAGWATPSLDMPGTDEGSRNRMLKVRLYLTATQTAWMAQALWVRWRFRQTMVGFLTQHRCAAQDWIAENPEPYARITAERQSRRAARHEAQRLAKAILTHCTTHELAVPDALQAVLEAESRQRARARRSHAVSASSAAPAKPRAKLKPKPTPDLTPYAELEGMMAAWQVQQARLAAPTTPLPWALQDGITLANAWLTEQLQRAREVMTTVFQQQGRTPHKKNFMALMGEAWNTASREQRLRWEQIAPVHWLLVPRSILDQTMDDLKKTVDRANQDRYAAGTASNSTASVAGSFQRRQGKKAGYPTAQRWSMAGSIRFQAAPERDAAYRNAWDQNQLDLPHLGKVKFRDGGRRLPPGAYGKLITIARDSTGAFYLSVPCTAADLRAASKRARSSQRRHGHHSPEQHEHASEFFVDAHGQRWPALPKDPETGFPLINSWDFSPRKAGFLISSAGEALKRRAIAEREEAKRKYLKQTLSRRQRGSNRYEKARKRLAKHEQRIAHRRHADHRDRAADLGSRHAIMALETLFIAAMLGQQKRRSFATADAAPSTFFRYLSETAAKHGHLVLKAPRFAATTQTCPDCGHRNPALKGEAGLKIRRWVCPVCAAEHDRDVAAARNIQREAWQAFLDQHRAFFLAEGWLPAAADPWVAESERAAIAQAWAVRGATPVQWNQQQHHPCHHTEPAMPSPAPLYTGSERDPKVWARMQALHPELRAFLARGGWAYGVMGGSKPTHRTCSVKRVPEVTAEVTSLSSRGGRSGTALRVRREGL